MEWYRLTTDEALKELKTGPERGLSLEEAKARLQKYGPNALSEKKKESLVLKFLKQFTDFIILVLIAAAVISGALGEWIDALAIMAIVILNGIISFIQEEKAARVIEALKKLSAPNAKVIRDGHARTVPASALVPGDIALIESGDYIPADCRVIESQFLRVQEAALTGESNPVEKDPAAIEGNLPLADRTNMAYSGTNAVYGRGKCLVVETGMNTEMGRIAKLLQEVKPEPTPLQKRLEEFGRFLVYAAGGICALIFGLGILRGEAILDMFLIAVSLAVAAIPEGLPAVVTIVLALGVQRMVRRHALIRKLPSVETLGAATIIASDKTGTLTQNQMTVKRLFLANGKTVNVSGTGYSPEGKFQIDSRELIPSNDKILIEALKAGVLCNGASLKDAEEGWTIVGDPTEGALLTLGLKAGLDKKAALSGLEFVGEIPFDAERKMMTMVYKDSVYHYAFVKGAVEKILPLCSSIGTPERKTTDTDKQEVFGANDDFSNDALRVLSLAYRRSKSPFDIHSPHLVEKDLTFLALAGMIDPPRKEVFEAVEKAKSAGITPIMITGDHKMTAIAIGKELGIFREGDIALSGEELDRMDENEFKTMLPKVKVYARVNPEHKLKVVKAWRERGETIAMTGDGVNDAPALKEADIGIAMGITGTDVTKEASDMVLTDDNFASIVSAVEEGRGIFDNIRRVVHFLLSCNMGEILVLLIASLTDMPLPLLPVQILWTNLVTDGLPALGLAMEPIESDIMRRSPRRKAEGIVTANLLKVMFVQGVFMAVCTLSVYAYEIYMAGAGIEKARTMAFMVLVFSQMFHVFNCRSAWGSVFRIGVFSNRMLNLAVAVILAGQFMVIYVPGLQPVFKTTNLGIKDWAIVFAVSSLVLIWMEILKAAWPKRPEKNF